MSPELNGNQPVLPKRNKKNRKHASTSNIRQFPMSACNVPYMNSYCSYPAAASFALHPEPMSLPIYPPGYHYSSAPVYNQGFSSHALNAGNVNGMNTTRMFSHRSYGTEECMSLPVGKEDLEEEPDRRRFSDPGVPNDSDSGSENESMFQCLTHQVNVLQESNRQLMREVTELRIELNILKQQQMHNGFEREYEPGMISDFIKEIRDAARIREDALLAKVKHIVEEKQFSDNQLQLASEKTRHNERLAKLEEQMKHMNFTTTTGISAMGNNLSGMSNNSLRVGLGLNDDLSLPSTSVSLSEENSIAANRQVCELEREVLQLRREVQDSRAKKEESDNKILQLEKRMSLLHRRESFADGGGSSCGGGGGDKTPASSMASSTLDNLSLVTSTQSSIVSSSPLHPHPHSQQQLQQQQVQHKFMQVGPVTDL